MEIIVGVMKTLTSTRNHKYIYIGSSKQMYITQNICIGKHANTTFIWVFGNWLVTLRFSHVSLESMQIYHTAVVIYTSLPVTHDICQGLIW